MRDLVDVGELDGLADADGAAVGFFLPGDHPQQGGLARAVGSHDPDDAARGNGGRKPVEDEAVVEGLGDLVKFEDNVPEARTGRDVNLQIFAALFGFLREQFFVGADACLSLGLARLGRHADPFEFAFERLLALRFGFLLEADALLLLFEPGGVVALPGDAVAAVEFEDPARHVVEEVAVVGDGDDGALVVAQVMFEPCHGLGVEVVGGLVEQEDIGFGEQEPGEGDAALLPAGENLDGRIGGRAAQGVHGDFEVAVQVPGVVLVELFLQFGLFRDQRVEVGVGFGEFGVDLIVARQHCRRWA